MRYRNTILMGFFLPLFLISASIIESAINKLPDAVQVTSQSIILKVNNTSDTTDLYLGDGVCDTDGVTSGSQCSLRAAIQEANMTLGTDTINFNIPGSGIQTIATLTALPTITDAVVIDGYSQPGAAPATNSPPAVIFIKIQIKAALETTADNTHIKGLEIFGQNYSSFETGRYSAQRFLKQRHRRQPTCAKFSRSRH